MAVNQSTEDIVSALQSLQNLEKQLHNELNQSLIQNTISLINENIYVGPSSQKTKTVNLPSNITFNSISPQGYVPNGEDFIVINNKFFSVKLNNDGSKQTVTVGSDSSEGWTEQLYLQGTGYLGNEVSNNTSLTKQSQSELIEKINKISDSRVAMFKSLNQMYDNSVRSSVNSRNDLVHQITALKLVESELNNAKAHIDIMKSDRDNKLRMAELNMYESDRYDAYVKFLKLILFVAIPSGLIYILLNINFFKSPESDSGFRLILKDILIIVMCAILVYGSYRIIMKGYDLSSRNNMNFNSYDFDFSENGGPTLLEYDEEQNKKIRAEFDKDLGVLSSDTKQLGSAIKNAGCIGQQCCSTGTVYSKKHDKCIMKSSS